MDCPICTVPMQVYDTRQTEYFLEFTWLCPMCGNMEVEADYELDHPEYYPGDDDE